jgi:hypothetical protein
MGVMWACCCVCSAPAAAPVAAPAAAPGSIQADAAEVLAAAAQPAAPVVAPAAAPAAQGDAAAAPAAAGDAAAGSRPPPRQLIGRDGQPLPFKLPADVILKQEIPMPRRMASCVIGVRGTTVTRLRRESGTKIHVRQGGPEENEQVVEIEGTIEAVSTSFEPGCGHGIRLCVRTLHGHCMKLSSGTTYLYCTPTPAIAPAGSACACLVSDCISAEILLVLLV